MSCQPIVYKSLRFTYGVAKFFDYKAGSVHFSPMVSCQ